MAKKKKLQTSEATASVSFEQALAKLQQIVQELEDGCIGLEEALVRYEQGVKYLKQCHHLLEQAERKIALLSGMDEQGSPLTQPFDEKAMSLEEKADHRSRRRSRRDKALPSGGDQSTPEGNEDMDVRRELF